MAISPDVRKAVQEPNKRIAVFGKFRKDDDKRRHVFGKQEDEAKGIHKLNGQTFIDVVRPELRLTKADDPKHQFKIGDIFFQGFHLKTPATDDGEVYAEGLPILNKSLLLSLLEETKTAGDPGKKIQETGGELFSDLLKHLDVSARYGHSNFVRAMSWILEIYVAHHVDQILTSYDAKATIDQGLFQKKLREDTDMRGEMIKYLLCLEDDEVHVQGALKAKFKGWTKDPLSPFATDDDAQARQLNQCVDTLAELKSGLLNESTELATFLKNNGGGWVDDMALGEFNFAGPATGRGRSFFGYYKTCKDSSDWLARFLRNDVMHSFLFCWLSSKYKKHSRAQFPAAGDKMFKLGVQDQMDRYVFESRAERAKRMSTVDQANREMAKEFTDEMKPHISIVANAIKSLFLPKHGYTREQLEERAIEAFILNCQLASTGAIAELHKEAKEFVAELNRGYQPVLRHIMEKSREVGISDEEKVTLATADLKEVVTGIGTDKFDAFVDEVFAQLEGKETVTAAEFKDLYVKNLTTKGLTKFKDGWLESEDEIKAERAKIERLGRMRLGLERKPEGEVTGMGAYINIVDMETLSEDQKETVDKKQQQKQRAASIKTTAAVPQGPIKVPLAVESRKESLGEGKTGQLKVAGAEGAEITVGTFSIDEDNLVIDRTDDAKFDEDSMPDPKDLKLVFPTEGEEEELQIRVSEIDDLEADKLFPEWQKDDTESLSDYDEMAQYLDSCHEYYVEGKNADFSKSMRGQILGETILSIPRGSVNLDSEHLSNVIGVIMEMVENIGDASAEGLRDADEFKPGTTGYEMLKNINLSEFFPLPDTESHQMSTVLQYHYSLCENLQNVKRYLEEIKEMRDYFEGVKNSDLEVQFYNMTFDEYPGVEEGADKAKDHVFLKDPPLVLYATAQSEPGSLSNAYGHYQRWLGLGKTAWKTDETTTIQTPIVVVHPEYDKPINDVGWPVFTSSTVGLPLLGQDNFDVGYTVQKQPYLLWATSLCEAGPYQFGERPSDWAPTKKLLDSLKDKGLPTFEDRETVHEYLRKCWLERADWLDQVILVKWINFALAQDEKELVPGADADRNNLARYLKDWYYESEGLDYQIPFDGLITGKEAVKIKVWDPAHPGAKQELQQGGHQAAPIPGANFELDGKDIPADWVHRLEPK